MQVTITGRHFEISPAIRDYAEDRLRHAVRHMDNVIDAQIVLSTEKYRQIAEVVLQADGLKLASQEETNDMTVSIDRAMEKLERQAKKQKGRRRKAKQRQAARRSEAYNMNVLDARGEGLESSEPIVIRSDRFAIKPMNVEEAVMQLQTAEGDDFLVFRNSSNDDVNVLYRRQDGHFGLIEPA